MRLISVLLSLFLCSCQIYKSAGRRQFEDTAPDVVDPGKITTQRINEECWLQDSRVPLAYTETGEQYQMIAYDNNTIEVCKSTTHENNH